MLLTTHKNFRYTFSRKVLIENLNGFSFAMSLGRVFWGYLSCWCLERFWSSLRVMTTQDWKIRKLTLECWNLFHSFVFQKQVLETFIVLQCSQLTHKLSNRTTFKLFSSKVELYSPLRQLPWKYLLAIIAFMLEQSDHG